MNKRYIYALGFFDGVHLGHQALLSACVSLARAGGRTPGAVTFAAHPDTLVLHETPGLINTIEDRRNLLRTFGMEAVVALPFDDAMRCLSWEDFLLMLINKWDAGGFVCGEDFRFGFRGEGNAARLADFCRQRGLPWVTVPEQELEGRRVSSTYIRTQLESGDMSTAVRFLGHPHLLTGTVVPGQHIGRTLGVPTANLLLPEGVLVPKHGVYACRCLTGGGAWPAVTNIGTRPTVSGSGVTVEPWILDYTGDLYGKTITLEFYRFLRPERKFPDLTALKAQIQRDAQDARACIGAKKP